MSVKMNLTRKVLKLKQLATDKKANLVSNSIYDVLEINNKSRDISEVIKKLATKELNVNHINIADVPCIEYTPKFKMKIFNSTPKDSKLLYLYIHGGGFIGGFPEQGTYLTKSLSVRFGLKTIAIDYTLSPEVVYPYALDQILSVYKEIIKTHDPNNIILGGESAGGNYCVALLLRLRDEKIPMPKMCFLASPYLDLTQSGESYEQNELSEVSLTKKQLKYMAMGYVYGSNLDIEDTSKLATPYITTTNADLSGLPPTFISVCTDEILYSDSLMCFEQLQKADIKCQLIAQSNCFHAYMIMGDFFEESSQAVDELEKFINSVFKIKSKNSVKTDKKSKQKKKVKD